MATDPFSTSPSIPYRTFADESRFVETVKRGAQDDMPPFLEEAWHCYLGGGYNAAMTTIWCAISCYFRMVIRYVGEEFFRHNHGKDEDKTLEEIPDAQLVETCRKMGLLQLQNQSIFDWLDKFRNRRNALAHGEWRIAATAQEVIECLTKAVDYYLQYPVSNFALQLDPETLLAFVEGFSDDIQPDNVKKFVDSISSQDQLPALCHDLLNRYKPGESNNLTNVQLVWQQVYLQLETQHRQHVIVHFIRTLAKNAGWQSNLESDGWRFEDRDDERGSIETFKAMLLQIDVSIGNTEIDAREKRGFGELFMCILQGKYGEDVNSSRYLKKMKHYASGEYWAKFDELQTQLSAMQGDD